MRVKATNYIKKAYLVNTNKKTKYNKLQLFVAKLFKLTLKDRYLHLFQIDYRGNKRLQKADLIVTERKVTLYITEERNWSAMAATIDAREDAPRIQGKFRIERKSGQTTKKNKNE